MELQEKVIKLGNPKWKEYFTDESRKKTSAVISQKAKDDPAVTHFYPCIKLLKEKGLCFDKIAVTLDNDGFVTRTCTKRFMGCKYITFIKDLLTNKNLYPWKKIQLKFLKFLVK